MISTPRLAVARFGYGQAKGRCGLGQTAERPEFELASLIDLPLTAL